MIYRYLSYYLHISFSVKADWYVGTPSPESEFHANVFRLLHKRRKWFCIKPERMNIVSDWWREAHFFCAYVEEVLLRDFCRFFSLSIWAGAESRPWPPVPWMGQAVTGGGQTRKNAVSDDPNEFELIDTAYFFWWCLPGFTLTAWFSFSFGCFFLLRISLDILFPICLCCRLPSFSRLSVGTHQAVISVLGAKVIPGLDGKARSSLLFSGKILPAGLEIFPEKPYIP